MSAASPAVSATAGLRTETLAGSVVVLLLMTVLQRGVGFVRGILFCRWLEPEELGQWDLAFGFLMLAAPVAVFGLTGSYGRYLEHYRQRGQARAFVRRTLSCVFVLAALAASGVILFPGGFARLVFGGAEQRHLVRLVGLSLLAVIAFNSLYELFGGLRRFRLAASLQFWHSLLFAALGTALALMWQASAESLVMAFGAAYALCAAAAIPWLKGTWRSLDSQQSPLGQRELWSKIVPFAAAVWVTNWLANLFDLVGRFMLVHYSGMTAAAALVAVGNYHSARVLPLPLLAIAALLRSAVLPHLSHDWECGRRLDVSARLNLALKLWGLTVLVASAGLLLVAPWVFEIAFRGKYAGGLGVLPATLAYVSWAGIATVASSYLWCAERAGLGSLPLLAGLAINIGLNLLLIPAFGLSGAVLATALANAVTLGLTLGLNQLLGLRVDTGLMVICAAPVLLMLGAWPVCAALLALVHQAVRRDWLFQAAEKRQLAEMAQKFCPLTRLRGQVRWQKEAFGRR